MKISHNFPVLQKANALFVVAGKQSAIIYRLRNGELHERETVAVHKPEHTDREGRFEHRSPRGKLRGSGSVYEPKDAYVQQQFITSLVGELKKLRRPYDSVYLFAPAQTLHDLEQTLPKPVVKKIVRKFAGNFTKHHPTGLLEKVKTRREFRAKSEAVERMSEEAAQILRRGERPSQRIGSKRKTVR